MPMRYLINAILVVVFLVVGELMIDGGVVSRYQTGVIEQIGIYIILAVSLNIATGYLGQLPLGHAGFMSVGGYSCAIFIMRMMDVVGVTARDFATGSPAAVGLFVLGIIFGGICAAICGLIIGVPALRLKGDYLAIITLGFAEIIRVVMQNIDSVLGFTLTGGAKGLTGIPSYTNFLNTFIVVVISLFLIHTMMKSRHGRAILSIRDNEIAAESCGVNTTYYKTLAFVASAFFAGVAGGLYAGCIGVMAPAKFGFMKSIEDPGYGRSRRYGLHARLRHLCDRPHDSARGPACRLRLPHGCLRRRADPGHDLPSRGPSRRLRLLDVPRDRAHHEPRQASRGPCPCHDACR